jgi:glutathione peroxidase-family protein
MRDESDKGAKREPIFEKANSRSSEGKEKDDWNFEGFALS